MTEPSPSSFPPVSSTSSPAVEFKFTPSGKEKERRESYRPLSPLEEIRRRAKILKQADFDPQLAAGLRELCSRDAAFFCNNFGWIYEPRAGREHIIPWQLYPHEYYFLSWLDRRFFGQEDGLVEKSRDMGVTWTFVLWSLHRFLFSQDFSCLIGSRKEDLVDNKLPDSIFGKYDFLLSHLPAWLLPPGWDLAKHRTYMKIVHPHNQNSLTGESTNPAFSRSGRFSVIFLDEFAFVEKSYSIWQASGDATSCRFAVSTPNGRGNKFAELSQGPIKKISLHWSWHPEKDGAWYEKEKLRRTADEVAQELDISYERSQRGRVYQIEWDDLKEKGRLQTVPYDPLLPVDTAWDFGIGDSTAILFFQETKAGAIHMIDAYSNQGLAIDHYIKIVKEKPYRYFRHYGDITVKRRELGTGRSVWEICKKEGIFIRGKLVKSKQDAINAAKLLLRKTWVDKSLVDFQDAIENYHYDFDEDTQTFSEEPTHDWSSHFCDALSYYALNYVSYQEEQTRPSPKKDFRFKTTTY